MNTKSLPATMLLLILLAPTASCCVNFRADYLGFSAEVYGHLYDNGEEKCAVHGYPAPGDGLYHFTCIAANFAALLNPDSGVVEYANPWGNFAFETNFDGTTFTACVYGCQGSECFVVE